MLDRSSIGEQAKHNIMSNELKRWLEVLSDDLSDNKISGIVDKCSQQKEIIVSALKGHIRRENYRRNSANKLKHRSGRDEKS